VDGDRYCGNIGRAHRSNGVWYVLDLVSCTAVQRCWDPQCKYFSSRPITVPTFLCEQARADEDEEEEEDAAFAELDEQKATAAAASAPEMEKRSSLLDEDDEWDEAALAAAEAAITAARSQERS